MKTQEIIYTNSDINPEYTTLDNTWVLEKNNKIVAVAKSDIGQVKKNNEDFYGVFTNQKDENLILVAVADGLGGHKAGEEASKFVIKSLGEFFKQCSPAEINDSEKYQKKLNKAIKKINSHLNKTIKKINKNIKEGDTTLTGAIINENDLIIFNIGDSRTYGYDQKLTQLTDDDSILWKIYKKGYIQKNDIRFTSFNCLVTNSMDDSFIPIHPKYKIVKDNPYSALLVTSDGVHDILSDETMGKIINSNYENPEKLINEIVKRAVYGNKERITEDTKKRLKKPFVPIFSEITPGKDNATAVLVLTKNKKE